MTRRWNGILPSCVAALFCGLAAFAESPQPITDEGLRVAALRASFPKMGDPVRIKKRIDDSWRKKRDDPKRIEFPDALAGEPVYRITGAASNKAERCASENLGTEQFSTVRKVRINLYRWPTEAHSSGLLAVLQYAFEGASPAGSCWSIGAPSVGNSLACHPLREYSACRDATGYCRSRPSHHSRRPSTRETPQTGHSRSSLLDSRS
jgi:hypothetical protein